MRTKLFKIAQAATLGIAITFTFSCSSSDDPDDGNGGGSNFPELPKQAYILEDGIESEYKGDGYITFRIPYYYDYDKNGNGGYTCIDYSGVEHECEQDEYKNRYETKSAGIIRDGQVLLDLPDIDIKYCRKFFGCLDKEYLKDGEIYECNISSPKNLAAFEISKKLYVDIPDKSNYQLYSYVTKWDDMHGNTTYMATPTYFSKSGKITGTECSGDEKYAYACRYYDLNFSKGWNVIYESNGVVTTDLSKIGGTFMWVINCYDDCT